ncbi:MAG: TraB/VirB10 family protein [Candidatus Thiodiazotropha sp.]
MTQPQETPIVPDRRKVRIRQYVALAGIVLVTVGFTAWALWSSFQPKGDVRMRQEKPVVRNIQAPAQVDPRDVWIAKSEEELLRLQKDRKVLAGDLDELRKELEAIKAQRNEVPDTPVSAEPAPARLPPLPPPPKPASAVNSEHLPPPPAPATATRLPPPPGTPAAGRQSRRPGQQSAIAELVIPLPEDSTGEDARTVDNYIPAGSFGRAILLSGIDAPTGGAAQNNPVPFVVKLKDHGRLPNGFRSRVRSCHVVLAGYGDISSERVYARTETLSCVLKDGSVLETPLKGYISGEDGKAGMRGRLVSKQGALIARSLLAGIFGGIGEGVSESYKTVTTSALGSVATVDPNEVFKQGAAEGIGTALDRISKWYLERADETYPVIEADAARVVDIVLTQGAGIGEEIKPPPKQPRIAEPVDAERMKTATLERDPWKK